MKARTNAFGWIALCVAVVSLFLWQRTRITELQQRNAELQAQLAERRQPPPGKPAQPMTAQNPDPELLRLRAEVAELRRQKSRLTRGPPTSRIDEAAVSADSSELPFEIRRRNNTQVLKGLVLGLLFAIAERDQSKAGAKLEIVDANGGPSPELRREIEKVLAGDEDMADIDLDTAWPDLEFLITDAADLGNLDPNTIVARTVAMKTPEGKWMRVYAIADGSAQLRVHQTPDEVWQAPPQ